MATTVSPEPDDNNRVNISAAKVKELRDMTGAPMMDCKQALTEAKGEIEKAIVCSARKAFRRPPRKLRA